MTEKNDSAETDSSGSTSERSRSDGRDGQEGPGAVKRDRPRPRLRRGRGRRRVCKFCADKSLQLDYKWHYILDGFVSERGRIVPSRTTGTCAKHQRALTVAVKRSRSVALLPFKAS